MADRNTPKRTTQRPAKSPATRKTTKVFSEDERGAIRDRAHEMRAGKVDGESELRAAIAKMQKPDRALAEQIDAIVRKSAPTLSPKTWYGMPAYAGNGGLVCWFQPAQKFKTRYAMIGFSDKAHLDDGAVWPISYALTTLSAADEARVAALVKKAVS